MTIRKLKIEASGDFFARRIFPAIRLKGNWLKTAGFNPGAYISATPISPGVLELRVVSQQKAFTAVAYET